MTILQSSIAPPTGGYQISRSLRFNSADSAYLNRTPASAGNRKTWTWSAWVKRGLIDANYRSLFCGYNSGTDLDYILFNNDYTLGLRNYNGTSYDLKTTQVFRDPSAWYHFIVAVDTTQATNTNRVKMYVNGVQITAFTTATYPSQNYNFQVNNNVAQYLGYNGYNYIDGYMTEVNFIDGQALTPSSFGQTNASTGVWEPVKYTGTYGTNGFYLNFSDNSNTTAATLGKDSSGNGNNWTPNNFSVTAGAGNDSLVDTPTPYGTDTGVGGEVRGNYCTLNPLIATATLSNGNLDFSQTATKTAASMGVTSGKWYCEATCNTTANRFFIVGVAKVGDNSAFNLFASGVGYYADNGEKYVDGTTSAYGATYTAGDIIGIALNMDAGTVTFYKNNTSQGSINLPTSSQGYYPLAIQAASGSTSATWTANFGQRPFAYTAPSGFKALCTQNLPTPTIGATSTTQANRYFDAYTYTGTGVNPLTISAFNFAPEFVWIKQRNSSSSEHSLFDIIRGATKYLFSNTAGAEGTNNLSLTAFNSNGYTLGNSGIVNDSSTATYVSWNWKANGAGVTNTAGSVTSTVSANTTAGFSIVTWSGPNNNTTSTVGHGLGVAPSMVIYKDRVDAENWNVWHSSFTGGEVIYLNLTSGKNSDTNVFNNTAPTSTLLTVKNVEVNGSSMVAYCWAAVAGYSAFGSYTGNGSTDGPFVYTGFRPRWLLIKNSSRAVAWWVVDTARNTSNVVGWILQPNVSTADVDSPVLDILSNGFRVRTTDQAANFSGETIIYAAFAESPFKYALAR